MGVSLEQPGHAAWLREALLDDPVGLWLPGVNDSGSTLRSVSPGWAEKVRRSNPVAWWRLGDGSDEIGSNDVSTLGGGLVLGGTSSLLGDDPSLCTDFDGSNDVAVVPYSPDLNPAAFTFGAWVSLDGGAGAARVIGGSRNSGATAGFLLQAASTNVWRFTTYDAGGQAATANSSSAATVGATTFVVGVYDGSAATMYVNGVVDGTPSTDTYVQNTTGHLAIGAALTGNSSPFNGKIQDVVLWDRALSADEIADLYLAGKSTHTATENGTITRGVAGPFAGSTARDYDGSTGYLSVPYARGLNPASAFTVEAWVMRDVDTGGYETVAWSRSGNYGFVLNIRANDTINVTYGTGAAATELGSTTTVPTGRWVYAAATYDGTTLRLYCDGVQVNSGAVTVAANTASNLGVGSSIPAGNYFNGKIGGVAIYREALSADRILRHYEAGKR